MSGISKFFNNLNPTQRYLVFAILGVVVFLGAAWGSFYAFSGRNSSSANLANSIPGVDQIVGEDPSLPRTEACPLNGSMHTVPAKDAWNKRRPLAVMIENHEEARPQSGLTSADVVYEAVAEGGITRFMAVFYCNSIGETQVGPVRSARTYFLDWASEYDPLYAHVGGANQPGPADALSQIVQYKIKDLNQFSIGFPTFWRDYQRLPNRATEHTMYSTTYKLWDIGTKRGWTATDSAGIAWNKNFTPWTFVDGTPGGNVGKVNVSFWESQGDYKVQWDYNAAGNCYKRKNGGVDHIDLNNKQQICPQNVVVQLMDESHANDGYEGNAHLLYGNKGTGKALVFQNGKVTEGKWVKANRLAREKFVDNSGKEIPFVKGQIWIETVPTGSKVTY